MKLAGWRPETPGDEASRWTLARVRAQLRDATRDLRVEEQALVGMASDLRPYSSPRHDQRDTNSCVANALCKALEIKRIHKYGHGSHVDLSRLAVYYLARELMDPSEVGEDDGTIISLGAEVLRRFGVCTEADWPFEEGLLFLPVAWRAMRHAYVHKIKSWYRVDTTGDDRVADVIVNLAADNPVVFGTVVGDNWIDYKAGEVLTSPASVRGRHATVLVGWQPDLHGGVFIGENSWGPAWGEDGFYMISPEVVASHESAEYTVIAGGWEEWAA